MFAFLDVSAEFLRLLKRHPERRRKSLQLCRHPLIALLSVVATSLLNLRELSRRDDAKTRPATDVISSDYINLLSTWRRGRAIPDWSIHDFCLALARLGGHLNRKHDHHPGWIILWRGWT